MKTYLHALSSMLVISFVLAWSVSPVSASPRSDSTLTPNPAAEAYLLQNLRSSGYADLAEFPEQERNISGTALANALIDPQVQSQPLIYIANLTVVDVVPSSDIVFPGNIMFSRVNFAGYVDLDSTLLHALWIKDSTFEDTLDLSFATLDGNILISGNTFESLMFTRTTINGSLDLRNNTFNKGIDFESAHIAAILLLDDSRFLGTEALSTGAAPLEFWTARVDALASLTNTHFAGEVSFANAEFYSLDMSGAVFDGDALFADTSVERSINFTGAAFNKRADFGGVTVGTTAKFENASFGQSANFTNFAAANTANFKGAIFKDDVSFESATMTRDVSFENASFKGIATFDYITVGRFSDFIGTTFDKEFRLYYTSVAWPYFYKATFNGPVNFEGMHAAEDFEITASSYNYSEPFAAHFVEVEGTVEFKDFNAPAGLSLSHSKFASLDITTEKLKTLDTAFIDISETDIEKALTIANINMKSFTAQGAALGQSTNLSNVGITQKLDMRNASIGSLKLDQQPQWPASPDNFKLYGMTYTDIDIGEKGGLTEDTLQSLRGLVNRSAYSPQAYEQLSKFLTDKGHPDWSAEVQLDQKRRERNQVLTHFSGAWFWSWFLDIFAGYGHRPVFAFIWSGLVIAVGAFVFRRKENMIPVEQGDAKVEYNPIWYSFALFLPYVDLGIASKWEPDPCRTWARNYKYMHMILGWVLAPIALLTFSGII